jgi:hypothetical protein
LIHRLQSRELTTEGDKYNLVSRLLNAGGWSLDDEKGYLKTESNMKEDNHRILESQRSEREEKDRKAKMIHEEDKKQQAIDAKQKKEDAIANNMRKSQEAVESYQVMQQNNTPAKENVKISGYNNRKKTLWW